MSCKIADNMCKFNKWFWVLSDSSPFGTGQYLPSLTFSKKEPKPVPNESMKWQRPTYETILLHQKKLKTDHFQDRVYGGKDIKINKEHPIFKDSL